MEVLRNKPLKGKIIVKSRLNWVTANGNIAQAMNAMKEDGISLVNIGECNFPYPTKSYFMPNFVKHVHLSGYLFLLLIFTFQLTRVGGIGIFQ